MGEFGCEKCGHVGRPSLRMAGPIGSDMLACTKYEHWTEVWLRLADSLRC